MALCGSVGFRTVRSSLQLSGCPDHRGSDCTSAPLDRGLGRTAGCSARPSRSTSLTLLRLCKARRCLGSPVTTAQGPRPASSPPHVFAQFFQGGSDMADQQSEQVTRRNHAGPRPHRPAPGSTPRGRRWSTPRAAPPRWFSGRTHPRLWTAKPSSPAHVPTSRAAQSPRQSRDVADSHLDGRQMS